MDKSCDSGFGNFQTSSGYGVTWSMAEGVVGLQAFLSGFSFETQPQLLSTGQLKATTGLTKEVDADLSPKPVSISERGRNTNHSKPRCLGFKLRQ